MAMVFAIAWTASIKAQTEVFFDDFNDDSGFLTDETANTGQVWEANTQDTNG